MWARAAAPVLDIVVILLFALLGRRSHERGLTVGGIVETATPFICGCAVGYFTASIIAQAQPRSLQFGLVVVTSTTVIGMLVRRFNGDGTATSFVIVAAASLAAAMLGWRLIALLFQ